jgi:hypothetical protein
MASRTALLKTIANRFLARREELARMELNRLADEVSNA